jgi:hypothetical protein
VPDLPPNAPVSHIEPSVTSAGLAYCSFDRHMLDDYSPYVFRTTDFGLTWTDITGNLPDQAHVWVVREDPKNPRILYAGTELGLFVTFDRGEQWMKLHLNNLPVVAVHDILVHPRDNDLILGTHGRGIWILDNIAFLQEVAPEHLGQDAYMFTMGTALRFGSKFTRYGMGDRVFRGENPPYGALITYYLREKPAEDAAVVLEIMDEARQVIRRVTDIPRAAGLNRAAWDLRLDGPRPRRKVAEVQDFFWGRPSGPQVLPGNYTVRLLVGEQSFEKPLRIRFDPTLESTPEDLEMQQAYAFELRDMQSFGNDALRALDGLLAQLQERKRTLQARVDETPEEVMTAIDGHITQITGIQGTLVKPEGKPFWSEGPRLIGRLSGLFGALEGANARPTAAQTSYLEELRVEFRTAMDTVNSYLGETAPELNRIFDQFQLPQVLIPSLIEY